MQRAALGTILNKTIREIISERCCNKRSEWNKGENQEGFEGERVSGIWINTWGITMGIRSVYYWKKNGGKCA